MMKTWLMRRSVRKPPIFAATARMISSVCRLPFIRTSPLPSWISSTPALAAAPRCRRGIDDLVAGDVQVVLGGDVPDLGRGTTRIALMIPASADSIAPRSELSSQGCTTMVETVERSFAAAIRRSYFDPGCVALASAGMTLIISLRISCQGTYDALAFGIERDCISLIVEPEQAGHLLQALCHFAGYSGARRQYVLDGRERLAAFIHIVGQELWE